jgi:hypothetical protein
MASLRIIAGSRDLADRGAGRLGPEKSRQRRSK